jgi:hypothetical protein
MKNVKIIEAINLANDFLESKLTTTDTDEISWPKNLIVNNLDIPSPINTSIGISTLANNTYYSSSISSGIQTLVKLQNEEGYWVKKHYVSIIDTLLVLRSYIDTKYIGTPSFNKGIAWIKSKRNKDGSWSYTDKESNGNIYPTALAIKILKYQNNSEQYLESSMNWLLQEQNSDGGWGESKNKKKSSPAHTAHVLLMLMEFYPSKHHKNIVQGLNYLVNIYHEKSRWSDYEDYSEAQNYSYKHYSTPWCIVTLIKGENFFSLAQYRKVKKNIILPTIESYIDTQSETGYWDLPHDNIVGIWTVHDTVLAIKFYLDQRIRAENEKTNMFIIISFLVGFLTALSIIYLPSIIAYFSKNGSLLGYTLGIIGSVASILGIFPFVSSFLSKKKQNQ